MKRVFDLYRNAFGGISKEVWYLSVMQFINRCGTMVFPFLSVYLKDEVSFDMVEVGAAMACFGLGSLLGVFTGGKIVDRIGSYSVMLFSLLTGGVLFLLMSYVSSFAMMCFGLFLLSSFSEAFRPAGMVAISNYSTKENYTRSVSLYRLAMNLGFSIGPAIGGFLAFYNYRLIFWVDGLTCIGAGLMLILLLKPKKNIAQTVQPKAAAEPDGKSAYRDRIYFIFLIATVVYAMSFFQFFSTMPLFYKEVAGMDERQIGWLLTLNGVIVATLEMVMIYKIEKKYSPLNWVMFGTSLLTISYLALLFFDSIPWLIVLMVVVSFSEMFAMPFMNTFMNERAHDAKRGQYASLYVMAWSVAQILIPLLTTNVISGFGYNALWIVMAILSVTTIALIYYLKKSVQKEEIMRS
jgi:predicted MFS family arabinose efflux permease